MTRSFFAVLMAVMLLFSFGCNKTQPKKPKLTPEQQEVVSKLNSELSKRVKAEEIDAHIANSLKMIEDVKLQHPGIPTEELDVMVVTLFYRNGKYKEVVEQGEVFRSLYPKSEKLPDVLMQVAYSNFRLEEFDRAANYYTTVFTKYPDYSLASLAKMNAAVNYDKAGSRDIAYEILEKMLADGSAGSSAANANKYLAVMYFDDDELEKAAKCALEFMLDTRSFPNNNPNDSRSMKIAEIVNAYNVQAILPDQKLFAASLTALLHAKSYDYKVRRIDAALRSTSIFTLGKQLDAAGNAPYASSAAYVYCSLASFVKVPYADVIKLIKKWETVAADPYPARFFALKIQLLAMTDAFDEAIMCFDNAPAEWKDADTSSSFASLLMRSDMYARALEIANAGLKVAPSHSGLKNVKDMCSLVGNIAPEIKGEDFASEKPVVLSELKGKVVLIDFWAMWCGYCTPEIPVLVDLYAKYKDQGFEILGVNLDPAKKEGALNQFMTDKKMTWPQIYEGKQWDITPRKDYKFSGIPFTVLVGRDGKIVYLFKRGKALEPAIKELLGKK